MEKTEHVDLRGPQFNAGGLEEHKEPRISSKESIKKIWNSPDERDANFITLYKRGIEREKNLEFPLEIYGKKLYLDGISLRQRSKKTTPTDNPHKIAPILVKSNDNYFWEFSGMGLKTLMASQFYLTETAQLKLEGVLETAKSSCFPIKSKVFGLDEKEKEDLMNCMLKMFDVHEQCKFFELVGIEAKKHIPSKLIQVLEEKKPSDYLDVNEAFINLRLSNGLLSYLTFDAKIDDKAWHDAETVYLTQKYFYSQYKAGESECFIKKTAPELKGVLIKTLGELVQSRIRLTDAPEFIGPIPHKFADPIARETGFMDSNWSLNLHHGRYSHILQIAYLSKMGNLTSSFLNKIVDEDLWEDLLDTPPYLEKKIGRIHEHEYLIHARNRFINPFNAEAFHEMLSTGGVSRTLEQLALRVDEFAGTSKERAKLAQAFGESDITAKRLKDMAKNVRLLEHLVALEFHFDLIEINEHCPFIKYGLVPIEKWENGDGPQSGTFYNGKYSRICLIHEAKKYFNKGYRVECCLRHNLSLEDVYNNRSRSEKKDINTLEDFDGLPKANIGFIVWPQKLAHL